DRRLDRVGVHEHGVLADIDEDGPSARERDCRGSGDEGMGDRDDLVSRPDPQPAEGEVDSVGAVRAADAVDIGLGSAVSSPVRMCSGGRAVRTVRGEFGLERADLISTYEGRGIEYFLNGQVYLGSNVEVLRPQIDEGNPHRYFLQFEHFHSV